jgi:alanyl-tRNA synthetase
MDVPDIFQAEGLSKLIGAIEQSSRQSYADQPRAMRIVADHLRGAVFLVADGVVPSNKEQGSVLRRLIRRALRQGLQLGVQEGLTRVISQGVIEAYEGTYSQLRIGSDRIVKTLEDEETIFRRTLNQGVNRFPRLVGNELTGAKAFQLFDTYGFPFDLSVEEAESLGVAVSGACHEEFTALMQEQQERSRQAAYKKVGRSL